MAAIFAGTRGYLDKIDVAQVTRYEAAMLADLRAKAPQLLADIRDKREIVSDTEKSLTGFLDDFARVFT